MAKRNKVVTIALTILLTVMFGLSMINIGKLLEREKQKDNMSLEEQLYYGEVVAERKNEKFIYEYIIDLEGTDDLIIVESKTIVDLHDTVLLRYVDNKYILFKIER